MRIIAGKYRRRKLQTNPGLVTRPITDRAKEPLFERLHQRLDQARVADIFAGTGTLGLESLSRGARSVVFIEQDRKAVDLLRRNIAAIGVGDETLCWRTDAVRCSYRPQGVPEFVPFDLIFFDPPYKMVETLHPGSPLFKALERLARSTVSTKDAMLCLRTPAGAAFEMPSEWQSVRMLDLSSMEIHLFEKLSAERSEESSADGRWGVARRMSADQRMGELDPPPTLRWIGDAADGHLAMIDQTRLPGECVEIDCRTAEDVWEAIQALRVRGAPAIGVAAAYGVVVGLQRGPSDEGRAAFDVRLAQVREYLATSRPTAVNLFWALDRMQSVAAIEAALSPGELHKRLLAEASAIEREDRQMCAAIGRHGAELLRDGQGVLTHCNAGGLATAGDGTALSVIFAAAAQGKQLQVYADETRPLLQGARLTTWELMQRGVPVTLICDSMAGWVMKEGRVQAVVTGADRIAANGDAANKIGTYSVALLAKAHDIPFYVAAPSSTFDLSLATGADIPIEQRQPEEITHGFGRQTAPADVAAYNPAFDVTPHEHIAAIVTERGLIRPVNAETVSAVLGASTNH